MKTQDQIKNRIDELEKQHKQLRHNPKSIRQEIQTLVEKELNVLNWVLGTYGY